MSLTLACAREPQQKKRKGWRHIQTKKLAAANSNKTRDPWFFPRCKNWKVKPRRSSSLVAAVYSFFFFTALATSRVAMLPPLPLFRLLPLLYLCRLAFQKLAFPQTNSYFFPYSPTAAAPSHRVYRLFREVLDGLLQNLLGCYHALDITVVVVTAKKFSIHRSMKW